MLVSPELRPMACVEFEADIYILFHNGYICTGFQTVIHVDNVRQTAAIVKINKVSLLEGNRGRLLESNKDLEACIIVIDAPFL